MCSAEFSLGSGNRPAPSFDIMEDGNTSIIYKELSEYYQSLSTSSVKDSVLFQWYYPRKRGERKKQSGLTTGLKASSFLVPRPQLSKLLKSCINPH